MTVNRNDTYEGLLIHPGETISDLLAERKITQKELAERSGISETFLSDVIRGKKDISEKLAASLEEVFDVPATFWISLQTNYDDESSGIRQCI